MRVAVIDLGTFSAILLVAESRRGRMTSLHEERVTVDLEYGFGGQLTPSGVKRAASALARFNRNVNHYQIDRGIVVATAAIRHARNKKRVVAFLRGVCDLPFATLSSKREAELSAQGALIGLPKAALSSLIIDIGGGSSEFILPQSRIMSGLPIGAAWATKAWSQKSPRAGAQRHLHYLAASEKAVLRLDARKFGEISNVVGVGGTITTLAAIKHRMRSFDVETAHGTTLSRLWIEGLASAMTSMSQPAIREIVPFDPSRARVLLAGTYLWTAVLNRLNADRVKVSARGLRWGVAAHLAGLP